MAEEAAWQRSAVPGPAPQGGDLSQEALFVGRQAQIAELAGLLSSRDRDRFGVPIALIAGLPGRGGLRWPCTSRT